MKFFVVLTLLLATLPARAFDKRLEPLHLMLKKGVENCAIEVNSYTTVSEYEDLSLHLVQKDSFFKAQAMISLIAGPSTTSQTSLRLTPYSHWGQSVTELVYHRTKDLFGVQPLYDTLVGGYYFDEYFRVLFDARKVHFLEIRQEHTLIHNRRHLICGKF